MNNQYIFTKKEKASAVQYNGGNSAKNGVDADGIKDFIRRNGDRWEDWIAVGANNVLFVLKENVPFEDDAFKETLKGSDCLVKEGGRYYVMYGRNFMQQYKFVTGGKVFFWNHLDDSIKEFQIEKFDGDTATFEGFMFYLNKDGRAVRKIGSFSVIGGHYPTLIEAERDKERCEKIQKIWNMLDATGGSGLNPATLNEVNLILEIIERSR